MILELLGFQCDLGWIDHGLITSQPSILKHNTLDEDKGKGKEFGKKYRAVDGGRWLVCITLYLWQV